MTALSRPAQRCATGTARRRRARLVAVLAGVAAALGVLGAPGAAVALPPVILGISADPAGPVAPGTPVTFSVSAIDPELGSLSYNWNCGPDGSSSTTCVFFGRGPHAGTVTVTDPDGESETASATVTVINVAPTVSIASAPTTIPVGQTFNLNANGSDANNDTLTYTWTIDGTTVNGKNISWSFPVAGPHSVSVTASDGLATSSPASTTINALPQNRAPNAEIFAPVTKATVGQAVPISALGSFDPDGDELSYAWDLDCDAVSGPFDDALGLFQPPDLVFTATGTCTVRLRVADPHALTGTDIQVITIVSGQSPVASFSFAPTSPGVGAAVTLTSSSSHPDGTITSQVWDLDNDGAFDDATGGSAVWTFLAPGAHVVSLKVTDQRGVSDVASQTINVTGPATAQSPASSASGPPQPASSASRIKPFPIVRIRGRIFSRAVIIDLLSVRAPRRALVRISCTGRSCPYRRKMRTSTTGRRSMRFKGLERRLSSGTVIRVWVTQRGKIGKYTRFIVRSGRAPARVDRCVMPGSLRPVRCPA